jgi:PIN domain nuclease of toxin-antitoxin system
MRLLLDTHVVLWELEGSRTVSPAAREAIEQATDLLFSVVSFAEIGVQAAIGKLSVPRDLPDAGSAGRRDSRPLSARERLLVTSRQGSPLIANRMDAEPCGPLDEACGGPPDARRGGGG